MYDTFATNTVWSVVIVAAGLSVAALVLTLMAPRRKLLLVNNSPEDTIFFYLLQNPEAAKRWIDDDNAALASDALWTYMQRHSIGQMADASVMPDDLAITLASGVQPGDWLQVTNKGNVYTLHPAGALPHVDGVVNGAADANIVGAGWVLRPDLHIYKTGTLFGPTRLAVTSMYQLGKWRWPPQFWHTLPKRLHRPGITYTFPAEVR